MALETETILAFKTQYLSKKVNVSVHKMAGIRHLTCILIEYDMKRSLIPGSLAEKKQGHCRRERAAIRH